MSIPIGVVFAPVGDWSVVSAFKRIVPGRRPGLSHTSLVWSLSALTGVVFALVGDWSVVSALRGTLLGLCHRPSHGSGFRGLNVLVEVALTIVSRRSASLGFGPSAQRCGGELRSATQVSRRSACGPGFWLGSRTLLRRPSVLSSCFGSRARVADIVLNPASW